MPILSGRLTGRRFRTPFSLNDGWREEIKNALEKYAFIEKKITPENKEVSGFVLADNAFSVNFGDMSSWLVDPYVIFALRFDKKVIDKKRLKRDIDEACKIWLADRGLERVPSAIKKNLKAALEEEAYKIAPIKTKTIEICWNPSEHYALLGATSENDCETIRKLFRRAFSMPLLADTPGLQNIAEGDGNNPDDISFDARIGFLDFVAYKLLADDTNDEFCWTSRAGYKLIFNNNASFSDTGRVKKVSVVSESVLAVKESLQAMKDKKNVDKLELMLFKDDKQWVFTLEMEPSVIRGLEMPIVPGIEKADAWRDRLFCYEEMFVAIVELGQEWLKGNVDGKMGPDAIQEKLSKLAKKRLE
jgi:recombination associated protein RdgC